jgi:hypothetical protein
VTDENDTAAGQLEPELIHTSYFAEIEDVIEQVRAAATLGLGVRVGSYLTREDGAYLEQWEVALLTTPPVRDADDEG